MAKRGVARERCFGLELDEDVVERTARGFTAYAERVEDAPEIPETTLDLVTIFHVLEHVEDPATCVRQLARWLAPGGLPAIETPNVDSLDRRLFRTRGGAATTSRGTGTCSPPKRSNGC